jgi:hypothetical protein
MTITLTKCASVYADQEIDHLSVVIQSIVGRAGNSLSASAIGYWTRQLHQISLRYTLLMVQVRRIKALLELVTSACVSVGSHSSRQAERSGSAYL